jgi:hypothetical protein
MTGIIYITKVLRVTNFSNGLYYPLGYFSPCFALDTTYIAFAIFETKGKSPELKRKEWFSLHPRKSSNAKVRTCHCKVKEKIIRRTLQIRIPNNDENKDADCN